MTNDTELMPGLAQEDVFEVQMRGYSRRQVDEYVARSRGQIRDLEERLSRSLGELERVRLELSTARHDLASKPAHAEVSERVGQILKLAEDEAKAQRSRAEEEIARHRDQAKQEAERFRAEARDQSERMLTAAQEKAENAIATARAEAEKMRNSARAESERTVSEAAKQAEASLTSAQAQAKQLLDEATMRATAIHDGAERRLSLLTSRHTETMRRLTEIRDVVTNLVASETSRGSLEEEVDRSVATTVPAPGAAGRVGPADGRHAPPAAPQSAGHAPPAALQSAGHAPPAAPQSAGLREPASERSATEGSRTAAEAPRPAPAHAAPRTGNRGGQQSGSPAAPIKPSRPA
jgi:cell division septum initiation protein DivIVA